jgi:hypothetical protein
VDDFGNVSGADPSGFNGARRNGYVIGKNKCSKVESAPSLNTPSRNRK